MEPPADAERRPPVIGDRVVVRHRLSDGSATDVLGLLTAQDADTVTVRTRDGDIDRVARARVILWKRVPTVSRGANPLRESAAVLQRLSQDGWVAETRPLGEWVLRSGGGWTKRANSCLALGDPGLPVDAAAAAVVTHATEHHIDPRVLVVTDSAEDRAFAELGWTSEGSTIVLVQRLVERLGEYPEEDAGVRVDTTLSESWLAAALADRPGPVHAARAVLTGRGPQAYASIVEDGRIVARGKAHVRGPWTGLAGLATSPECRNRGLMTRISTALGLWAARLGARSGYVQVESANTTALERWRAQGYVEHHRYHYRRPA